MLDTYFVYIRTNPSSNVLYIGMTNNLQARLIEHYLNKGKEKTFAGSYFCYHLVYYMSYPTPSAAIARETELKSWNRKGKDTLMNEFNPEWWFLNEEIMEWPPAEGVGPRWVCLMASGLFFDIRFLHFVAE